MDNIEKSGFHRGEYVGYSDGAWRITKSNSSFGNWVARKQDDPNQFIYAFNLKEMSKKLHDVHYNIMKVADKNISNNRRKKNPKSGSIADSTAVEIERIKNFEYGEIIPKKIRVKNPKKGSYAELKPRKEINFRIYAISKTGEKKYLASAVNLFSAKVMAKAIAHRFPHSRITVYKE